MESPILMETWSAAMKERAEVMTIVMIITVAGRMGFLPEPTFKPAGTSALLGTGSMPSVRTGMAAGAEPLWTMLTCASAPSLMTTGTWYVRKAVVAMTTMTAVTIWVVGGAISPSVLISRLAGTSGPGVTQWPRSVRLQTEAGVTLHSLILTNAPAP